MTKRQRIALRIAIVLFAIAGGLFGTVLAGGRLPTARAGCSTCTGTWYGASSTLIAAALAGDVWPQTTSNACGIEDAVALVNYDDQNSGQSNYFTSSNGQTTVENANQTSGASQWGHATPTNAWGGITNIAPDFGTDPRSVAYDTWNYSLNNRFFHDYIYHWQYVSKTQPSFSQQALQATTLLARPLENWTEPVGTFINGGLHAVIVTGVWSSNDPDKNLPAGLQGLVYRDPEGDAVTSRQEIDINTWIDGGYSNPWGTYSLWSLYYGDLHSVGDEKNTNDPEPSVGPYKPGSGTHHWFLGFTWVQRDNNYTNGQWSPHWAYNAVSGAKLTTPW